jgi:hypothetical protein
MSVEGERPPGLLGPLRADGPPAPPPITPRAVLTESRRLVLRLMVLLAIAAVAAGVGYFAWGATGAWIGFGVVVGLKLVREPILRALLE